MTQTIRWRTTVETGLRSSRRWCWQASRHRAAGEGAAPALGDVTFTKDVAPILHRSCVNCHRPGSIAPMSAHHLRRCSTLGASDTGQDLAAGWRP